MAIKLLEPAVRSRLRSGFAITSVSQCVGELVENSIDAGATCVAVRIDVVKFKVQVRLHVINPRCTHTVGAGF